MIKFQGSLPVNTDYVVYQAPLGSKAVLTLSFVNTGGSSAVISLGRVSAPKATYTTADYQWVNYTVDANEGFPQEWPGLVMSPGEVLIAKSDSASVNFAVNGFETPTIGKFTGEDTWLQLGNTVSVGTNSLGELTNKLSFQDKLTTDTLVTYTQSDDSGTAAWACVSNKLQVTGAATNSRLVSVGSGSFSDVTASVQLTVFEELQAGLVFRHVDSNNFYLVRVTASNSAISPNLIQLVKRVSGTYTVIASTSVYPVTHSKTHTLKVTASGSSITVYLNGNTVVNTTDAAFTTGGVGVLANNLSSGGVATFKNLNASSSLNSIAATFTRSGNATEPGTNTVRSTNQSRAVTVTNNVTLSGVDTFSGGTHSYTTVNGSELALPQVGHHRASAAYDEYLRLYNSHQPRFADVTEPISFSKSAKWNTGTYAGTLLDSSNNLTVASLDFARASNSSSINTQLQQVIGTNQPLFEDGGMWVGAAGSNQLPLAISAAEDTISFAPVGTGVVLSSTTDAWQGTKSVVAFTQGAINTGLETIQFACGANASRVFSVYVKSSVPCALKVEQWTAGGTLQVTLNSNSTTGSGTWERLSIQTVTKAFTALAKMTVYQTSSTGPTAIQVDALQVNGGAYSSPFCLPGATIAADSFSTSASGINFTRGLIRYKLDQSFVTALQGGLSGAGVLLFSGHVPSAGNNHRLQLYLVGNNLTFLACNSTGVSTSRAQVITHTVGWHTVGWSLNGTQLKMYLDGQVYGPFTLAFAPGDVSTRVLGIGGSSLTGYANAPIKDFTIWDTVGDDLTMQQYTSSTNSDIPITSDVVLQALMRSDTKFYRKASWVGPWVDTNVTNAGYQGFSEKSQTINGSVSYLFRTNSLGQDSGASGYTSTPAAAVPNRFIQPRIDMIVNSTSTGRSFVESLDITPINYGQAALIDTSVYNQLPTYLGDGSIVSNSNTTEATWPRPDIVNFREAWVFQDNSTTRTMTVDLSAIPYLLNFAVSTRYIFSCYVTKTNLTAPTFGSSGAVDLQVSADGGAGTWSNFVVTRIKGNVYRVSGVYTTAASIGSNTIVLTKGASNTADQIFVAGLALQYVGTSSVYRRYPATLFSELDFTHNVFNPAPAGSPRGAQVTSPDNYTLPGDAFNTTAGSFAAQVYLDPNMAYVNATAFSRIFNTYSSLTSLINAMELSVGPTTLTFITTNNAGTTSTLIANIPAYTAGYHTLGCTWSGTSVKLFFNGSLVGTLTGSINLPQAPTKGVYLGSRLGINDSVPGLKISWLQVFNQQIVDSAMQQYTKGDYIPVVDSSTTTQVLFDGNLNQTARGTWVSPWTDSYFTKTKFTGYSLNGTNVTSVEFRTNSSASDSGASAWTSDFSLLPVNRFVQTRVALQDANQVKAKLVSLTLQTQVPNTSGVTLETGATNLLTTAAAPASEAVAVTPSNIYWLTKYQDGSRVNFTRASTGYDHDFNSYGNNVPVFTGHVKQLGTYNYLAPNASNAETNSSTGITLTGTPVVTRTQDWKMSGSYSFSVAGSSISSYVSMPSSISLTPKHPLVGSAWVYNPNTESIEIVIGLNNTNTVNVVIPALTSQRISVRGLSLGTLAVNSMSLLELSGKTFYFDQAQLELNPEVTDWVVGGSGRKIEHNKEGLLVTTGYNQIIQRTEDLSNAYWTKSNSTVALSSSLSPRADATVYKLAEDNTTGEHSISVAGLPTSVLGITTAFFAKAQERSKLVFSYDTHNITIDLAKGRVDSSTNPTYYLNAKLKYFGDGWWKVSITYTTTMATFKIALANSAGSASYAGTTGSGMLIWGINAWTGIRSDMPYSPRDTASSETIYPSQLSYTSPALSGKSYTMFAKYWSDQVLNSLQRTPVSMTGASQLAGTGTFLAVSVANTTTAYGIRFFEALYGAEAITKADYGQRNETGSLTIGSYPVGESMRTSGLMTLAGVVSPVSYNAYIDGFINSTTLGPNYTVNDVYDYATYTVRVGHNNNSGSHINGWVKELAIYDRALSQQEIHMLSTGSDSSKPNIYWNFNNTIEPSLKNNWFRRARIAHRVIGSTSSWASYTPVRLTNSSGNWTLTTSAAPTFARASSAVDQFGATVTSGNPRYYQGLNIIRNVDSDAESDAGAAAGSWSQEGGGTITLAAAGSSTLSNPKYEAPGVIHGAYALTVSPGTTAVNQGIRQSTGSRSFVKPNTQYTVSALIKSPVATQNFRLSVTYWNNTTICSTPSSASSFTSIPVLEYGRISHTFTTPVDCNYVEIQIVRSEASSGVWVVDGVQLEEGPTASGFMRGGVPHSSGVGNTLSSIMVEEGTTNGLAAGTIQTFQGWTTLGSTITLTQGQTDPFGTTGATRIQSSGSTNVFKYGTGVSKTAGTVFTSSVWVKNLAANPVTISTNHGTQDVPALSGWTKVEITATAGGVNLATISFVTSAIGIEIDLLAFQPQIEDKPYATSYQPGGARAAETLFYPTSAYQSATVNGAGTISILTYIDKELITGNTASRDYYLLSMGTPGAANSFRIYKASGATTALTFETVDTSGTARSINNTTAMARGWNLIVLAWNPGTQTSLTVNGTAVSSSGWPLAASMPTTWSNTYLGSASDGTGQWNQPIDDLRIWDNIYNTDTIAGLAFGSKAGMFYPTNSRNSYRLKFENSLGYGLGGYIAPASVNLANLGTAGSYSDFRIVGTGFSNSSGFAQFVCTGLPNQVNASQISGVPMASFKAGIYTMMTNAASSVTFDKNIVQLTPGTVGSGTVTPQLGIVSELVGTYTPIMTLAKVDFVQDCTSDITRIVPVTANLTLEPYGLSKWQLENRNFPSSWTPNGSPRNGELITMTASSIINTSGWTVQMAIEPFKPSIAGNFANVFFQIGGNVTNGFMKLWQNHNGIGYQIQDSSGGSVSNTIVGLGSIPRDHKIRIAVTQTAPNTFVFFINGTKYSAVTTTNPVTSWNDDTVRLGSPNDTSNWCFSHFSAAKTVLSDSALINWTAGDNSATVGLYPFTLALGSGSTTQQATGVWTSDWIDTKYKYNLYRELDSIATTPAGTSITYEYRTANMFDQSDATAWSSSLVGLVGQYIQVRATFSSNDITQGLPVLKHLDLIKAYGI